MSNETTPSMATGQRGNGNAAISGHEDAPGQTISPIQAARMCRVRRETIWKWTRDGKLPVVLEPNAQGRLVRRIPLAAVEALVADGVRGPATQQPLDDDWQPGNGNAAIEAEALREQLLLVAETASSLRERLCTVQAQIEAAVGRLNDTSSEPWWRRRGSRQRREAEALGLLRSLASLPSPPDLPEA